MQPLTSLHTDEHVASTAATQAPGRDGGVCDDSLATTGTAAPLVTLHSPEMGIPNIELFSPDSSVVPPDSGSGPRSVGNNSVGSPTPDDREQRASGEVLEGGMEGSGALEKLWVCDGDGRRVLFADVSVYTR